MEENKQAAGTGSQENSTGSNQSAGSGQQGAENNPQKGEEWNNYQSRELAGNGEGGISAEEAAEAFKEKEE